MFFFFFFLHKLLQMSCSEITLKWFSSYLTDRRQRVVINGQASQWTFVKAGIPTGSILGPLLFLVYINDIVSELIASVRHLADHTRLYIIVKNPNTDTCDSTNHITIITDAAWTRLNLLRTVKFKVNRRSLENIYSAFIRPVSEYSDSVLDNATTDSKKS